MNSKVCFIELSQDTNHPEEKTMRFDIFDLLSRAHIKSISFTCFVLFWTLHQFNVAYLYSCLFHFLFYKVNLILLQKYLHVTIVRVGIWMHEYLWIIISFWIRGFTLIGNLIGKSGVALAKYQITHQKMWCPVPYHVTHK